MQITPSWLRTDAVQFLMLELAYGGHSAYAVGGCVRDALMGRKCNDIDISTSRTPDEVQAALSGWPHCKLIPTGVEHGTWTAVVDDQTFEITSFRKDVATDGRRAAVSFSRSVFDDAMRRDFNMNALYMDYQGKVTDPTGVGVIDCMQRIVRFVGDAEERCREDYLRILRLFRFHAQLGVGPMDGAALNAAKTHAEGLMDHVSGERIWAELKKLLDSDNPTDALVEMQKAGVLGWTLPGRRRITDVASCAIIEKTNTLQPRWQRRYVALHSDDQPITIDYPHSKADIEDVEKIRAAMQSDRKHAARAYKFGPKAALDAFVIEAARDSKLPTKVPGDAFVRGENARLPVASSDLRYVGVEPGPKMGDLLRYADSLFVDSDLRLDREALMRAVAERVESVDESA